MPPSSALARIGVSSLSAFPCGTRSNCMNSALINTGQLTSTARYFPIPTPTLPLKGREKILGTLPPPRRSALSTLLPLQGGGWEGDGADSDALIPSINAGQVASTARCFPIPLPTLPLKGREKILGTLPPSRRSALSTPLPLQGGGWEGDGADSDALIPSMNVGQVVSTARYFPIPTPTLPLKGREKTFMRFHCPVGSHDEPERPARILDPAFHRDDVATLVFRCDRLLAATGHRWQQHAVDLDECRAEQYEQQRRENAEDQWEEQFQRDFCCCFLGALATFGT